MNYSLNPITKLHYLGHVGGYDDMIQFRLREEFPLCRQCTSKEHSDKILSPNPSTMRGFIKDSGFEGKDREEMMKPNFLFGDKIESSEGYLLYGNYKWLQ